MVLAAWRFLGAHVGGIIAVCALVFTAYQAMLTRKHNKLSVRPHLTSFTYRKRDGNQGSLRIDLINNGLGPAMIDAFEISINGQRLIPKTTSEIHEKISEATQGRATRIEYSTLGAGYCMPREEARTLLQVQFPAASDDEIKTMENSLATFSLVVRYSSMYGDRYVFGSDDPGRH